MFSMILELILVNSALPLMIFYFYTKQVLCFKVWANNKIIQIVDKIEIFTS